MSNRKKKTIQDLRNSGKDLGKRKFKCGETYEDFCEWVEKKFSSDDISFSEKVYNQFIKWENSGLKYSNRAAFMHDIADGMEMDKKDFLSSLVATCKFYKIEIDEGEGK